MKKIERSAWNPPEMVVPHGAFSHVVWVSGVQKWLFLTDKASVTADGSIVREGDAAAQMQWVLELIGIGLKSGGDLGQCCAVVYAPGWARFRDPVPGDEGPVLWRGLP